MYTFQLEVVELEIMESTEGKGYVYCNHCDNVVSRSTFQRHERKRYLASSKSEAAASWETTILGNSDSDSTSTAGDEGE